MLRTYWPLTFMKKTGAGGSAPAALGSYEFTNGDFLQFGSAPVSTYPITIAWWFKSNAVNINAGPILYQLATAFTANELVTRVTAAGVECFRVGTDGLTNGSEVVTTAAYTANTWHLAIVVFANSASEAVYLNGGNSASDASSVSVGTLDRLRIGHGQTGIQGAPCQMAHVAIWDKVLSAGEIASLAALARPSNVAIANLLFYAPLNEGSLVDTISSNSLSNTGCVANLTDGPALV